MKRFLLRILIFAVLILLFDKLAGVATGYLTENAISGDTQKTEYICDHSDEDILIFGSSRAVQHYDPRIIEDSLGMTCYNCGYNGCGIISAYGLLTISLQHHEPEVILYDVFPSYDYLKGDKDNVGYLSKLKVYYDREGIDSLFQMIDPSKRVKMKSHLYRINSRAIKLLSENIVNKDEYIKGFKPVKRKMDYEPTIVEMSGCDDFDPVKMECLNDFVGLCARHDIKLIFLVSPGYLKTDIRQFAYIEEFARGKGVPYINHYCDSSLNRNKDFFCDQVHMNRDGAEIYTKMIVGEVKKFIER